MEFVAGADVALGAGDRVRIGDGLTLGGVADDFLAAGFEGDDGGGGIGPLGVRDDFDFAIGLHAADDRIGGAEVDAYDDFFCHND